MMGVSREKLRAYSELLLKWNNSINLISSSTIHEVLERHINDSLQLLSFIQKDISIIDLGSGGGFLGLFYLLLGLRRLL
jgi:16S rRNA (guanine527-N7)-methyltransferase